MNVVVCDYGAGNLHSVAKACARVGMPVTVTSEPGALAAAAAVILPGVGAFGPAMDRLRRLGLDRALGRAAAAGIPLCGICLGYQLLFEGSTETPPGKAEPTGLGLLPGCVRRLPAAGCKVPHMGWNQLEPASGSRLLAGLPPGTYTYFVHSYCPEPGPGATVAAWTTYGGVRFAAAVEQGRIWGTQFHPEKSGRAGLRVLANFARLVKEVRRPCWRGA